MIPFLTYPLALAALATLPALTAIYLLRNRFRRRTVSSLMLWHFTLQSRQGGTRVHRLQLPLLFFLELLALALLVTAATGPHWKSSQNNRPLIVVLDDSFSMRAVHDGASAQARAQKFLEGLFHHGAPPSVRLILAGKEPHSLGSIEKNWSQVAGLLSQWTCRSPDARLEPALTLAVEAGKDQANILILTDHKPDDENVSNRRVEWHSFGAAVDNIAIVNASRVAFENQDRCLLEIANFSTGSRSARLLVQAGTNTEAVPLSLDGRGSRRLVFNVPSATPSLHASLDPDALADDDDIQLLPPIRKRVRVQVRLPDENLTALADRILAATGLRSSISADPEIIIHDNASAATGNAWDLFWLTGAATNAFTGPFIIDDSHPVAQGMALDGIVWAAANITNAPGDVPIILAGNVPLVSTRDDAFGTRHLTLNYNPGLSTLQDTPALPILFWNLLRWRSDEMPGLKESNARLGADVTVKTDGHAVTMTRPDGVKKDFPATTGDIALETPMPGIYSVATGTITNQFSVNTIAADESDVSGCASGQWGKWSEDAQQRLEEASATWIFGLLALALLATHLWLVATAKGAR